MSTIQIVFIPISILHGLTCQFMYGASHGPYPSSVGSTVRGPDEVSLSGRPLTVEITATTKKIQNTLALYINENDGTNIGANGRIGVILVTSESKTLPPVIRVRVTLQARQVASAFVKKRSHAVAVAPHSRAKMPGPGPVPT